MWPPCATSSEKMSSTDFRDLARTISRLEDNHQETVSQVMQLPLDNPRCHIIGITGPPGAGKSTLCNQLLSYLSEKGRVAILMVDPASPFSGGAILGDRIRLNNLAENTRIYARSLSNRGNPGGVSRWVVTILRLLMDKGFDYLIIETVGAGQSEVKIASIADTTVVVAVPQLGDDVQTAKAGMMEIADIFVVNKADLPGSKKTANMLREVAEQSSGKWKQPVCQTVATTGEGSQQLVEELSNHHNYLVDNCLLEQKRRNAARFELVEMSSWLLHRQLDDLLAENHGQMLVSGRVDIYNRLEQAYKAFIKSLGEGGE